tara:strand:+ start:119 stop:706 length:588 start_codon:yes stop_codon:yes gene_type:complete
VKEVIFFSNNKNKIFEIQNMFSNLEIKLLSLNEFEKIESPNETGKTFEENAKIKASYGYNIFNKPCFADDSGICIEAMSGNPGVKSKKFLEINNGLTDAFKKIALEIKRANNDKAIFKTSICLVINKKEHLLFNGEIEGKISKKILGVKGFGYDPIFIPKNYNDTFAEMPLTKKNSISHRQIAIKKLRKYLLSLE